MNIINNELNTKVTIKIEPPEQEVCNVIDTTCTNLYDNIKIEKVEYEVPVFYEDENLREIPADKNTNRINNDIPGPSQQNTTILNIDNSQSLNKNGGNILYHQCNICDYKSFVKHTLDKHMKLHDLNRKYQCDVCLFRFNKENELYKHMSKHSNKKYSCRVCGRQYRSEDSVIRHMYVHEGIPYRCDMCEHVCRSYYLLSTHMSQKHKNSYKCNVCLKMFTNISHYTKHMKMHLKLKS